MIPFRFRPTLAYRVDEDFSKIKFPVMASYKIDGIRCVFWDQAYSRSLKPIRNQWVQKQLAMLMPYISGMDGELSVGSTFQNTSSGIMSESGEPDFTFWVFDRAMNGTFLHRTCSVEASVNAVNEVRKDFCGTIRTLEQFWIENAQQLAQREIEALSAGHEGLMIRDPYGIYKYGRSTEKERILGKIKRFHDSEAIITEVVQLEENNNPKETNALGLSERSHDSANKTHKSLMGALICEDLHGLWNAQPFGVGTGFTASQRSHIWKNKDSIVGKILRYKYLSHGSLLLPRHPVFLNFRHKDDI